MSAILDEQLPSFSELWRPLLTLVSTAVVLMGSPGPSTMSVTAVGAAFGPRRSLRYTSGLVLGTWAILLAVATGVVALLLSMPGLAPVLRAVSALYMLYLAFKIATAAPLSTRDRDVVAPSLAGGFVLAVANAKAYLTIATAFASATLASLTPMLDLVLKAAVLAVMIVLIHLAWLLAGASLASFLRDPVRSRIANVVFAAVLIGTAILALRSR
jgi:threonine/homoserine/homoserine lactone efflux protein